MGMVPYERALVKRMQGKPFAIVGVNHERSRERLKAFQELQDVPGRHFWEEPGGAIATIWGVEGFPTLYILDGKGIIQDMLPGAPRDKRELDEIVQRAIEREENP